MADWDADTPQLNDNLTRLLRRIREDARRRDSPTVEDARHWHAEAMQNLQVPDQKFVGAFRGEAGLENIQVRMAGRYGVTAPEVAAELAHFEQVLQRAIGRLDEWIPREAELDADQLSAIVEVCAWAHAEWVRIHPFANGNGRTARLWVNSIASRYRLPPFLRLRPRPAGSYGIASERAMLGDRAATVALFHELLANFATDAGREAEM
jgi:Fic family protein